jgi:hypothetical protein
LFRFGNGNPLLQQHVLIPYTFNRVSGQLEYNQDVYGPKPKAWLNNRKYLSELADDTQVKFWLQTNKNLIVTFLLESNFF